MGHMWGKMKTKTNRKKSDKFIGIRYRFHSERKLGRSKKPDRYFYIRYRKDNKYIEEGFGWESRGFTEKEAAIERDKITKAIKLGKPIASLKERREHAKKLEDKNAARRKAEKRANITFGHYFTKTYWPEKDTKSKDTEKFLYENWIKPIIGEKKFPEIRELDLTRIKRNAVKAGKSLRTVEYCFAVIRQVFGRAKDAGIHKCDHPVTKEVKKKIKYDNKKTAFYSKEEVELLLDSLLTKSKQVHDMVILSVYCGLRLGECFNLDWADVDLKNRTLHLRNTKSSQNRSIPMPDKVMEMFENYIEIGVGNNPVFVGTNGKRVNSLSRTFRRTINELGFNDGVTDRLQRKGFHTCRHTYASWLAQAGIPLYSIQKLLGHSSIKVTERYSHLSPEYYESAVEALNDIGRSESGKQTKIPKLSQIG